MHLDQLDHLAARSHRELHELLAPSDASRLRGRRALVVALAPPRADGRGDQRRAAALVASLEAAGADVEIVSWLPDIDAPVPERDLRSWARAIGLALLRPVNVAMVQSRAPRAARSRLEHPDVDVVIYVTSRAAIGPVPADVATIVDFVDDLAGAASLRRAAASPWRKPVWWFEANRQRAYDRSLARHASRAVACSPLDAAAIDPRVGVVPLAMVGAPRSHDEGRIVFTGNLDFGPNLDAALWLCRELAPALAREGVDPRRLLIAGRYPSTQLAEAATRAGVELRANVPDLQPIVDTAAVVVVPITMGSGIQNKVLDAAASHRPMVVTPFAARGLPLVDGISALVRSRRPATFAAAVRELLERPELGSTLSESALVALTPFTPAAVARSWSRLVDDVIAGWEAAGANR